MALGRQTQGGHSPGRAVEDTIEVSEAVSSSHHRAATGREWPLGPSGRERDLFPPRAPSPPAGGAVVASSACSRRRPKRVVILVVIPKMHKSNFSDMDIIDQQEEVFDRECDPTKGRQA